MSRIDTTSGDEESEPIRTASADRHHVTVEAIQVTLVLVDILLFRGSTVVAHLVWVDTPSTLPPQASLTAPFGVLGAGLFVAFLALRGAYTVNSLSEAGDQARLAVYAWIFAYFVMGWVAFLMKYSAEFSRGATLLDFVTGLGLVVAVHGIAARWLGRRFAHGAMSLRRVAVITVDDDESASKVLRRRLEAKGVEIVSCTKISTSHLGKTSYLSTCDAAAADVRRALASVRLDSVLLFLPWTNRRQIDELRTALSPLPVPAFLFADRATWALLEQPQIHIGTLRGFELQRAPLNRFDQALKRTIDLTIAGVALTLRAPLMSLVALAIRIETGRTILSRQSRKGFGARPFQTLKFRSMTVQENGSTATQVTRGDARITRLGAVLRKTSIDELPQLVSVLAGDMSIVGPRLHAIAHDDHYDTLIATYAFRRHVKPGITGWAQVNGHRGETRETRQMSARVEHNLWYMNNWLPWLDVKIIVRTTFKVLLDDVAY